MIKKTVRTKLQRTFKGRYIKEVQEKLLEKNIFSLKGRPYTANYISQIFHGIRHNEIIENAILEVYQEKKKAYHERKKIINQIILN